MTPTKPKKCATRGCPNTFTQCRSFEKYCVDCATAVALSRLGKEKKAKAVNEKRADRAALEKMKKPSKLEAECRAIVQELARIRDRFDGCISCHMGPNYDGLWHGSHFRPAGNNAAVQFHLWNIHKSCAQCNLFKGGNLGSYRPRLIAKIGLDKVEWLESQNQQVKTNVPYLIRFKAVMGKRLRRVKKNAK